MKEEYKVIIVLLLLVVFEWVWFCLFFPKFVSFLPFFDPFFIEVLLLRLSWVICGLLLVLILYLLEVFLFLTLLSFSLLGSLLRGLIIL